MREKLIAHDVVECVLGLGPNLFYNSPMEACILICRMNKPKERHNRILFINAVNEVTRERAQSFLTDEHIKRIVSAYVGFEDVEGFAKVASVDEIRKNECSLNLPLYVNVERLDRAHNSPGDHGISVQESINEWQASSKALRESITSLLESLEVHEATGGDS